jgi:hypothetical protein
VFNWNFDHCAGSALLSTDAARIRRSVMES